VWASYEIFAPIQKLEKNNQLPEALAALQVLRESKPPEDIKALTNLYSGLLNLRLEKFADAKVALTQSLQGPLRLDDFAHYHLGLVLAKLGDTGGAKRELEIVKSSAGKAFLYEARFQTGSVGN